MSFYPLDGPSKQFVLNPTTSSVVRVKAGASEYTERKVITLQPTDGNIYVYFADYGETPTANDVSTKGFIHFKHQKDTYEASETQIVFILSAEDSDPVNVRGAERA